MNNPIKKHFQVLYGFLLAFGFDPKKMVFALRGLPSYINNFFLLKKQEKHFNKAFVFGSPILCLDDRFLESGNARGHYFYQDWLVANRIFENNPKTHFDVGSRVDGFVSHVASFRVVHVIDIRPLSTSVPNIKFVQADLMSPVVDKLVDCCDSLSCLHTLEHFGLGRYGDPIQYDGYLVGLDNLSLLLRRKGKFYFSVPMGDQRVEYNAHRVFSARYLLELLSKRFSVDYFSFVDDNGGLHTNVPLTADQISRNFGCVYGCAIFEMTKL